MNRRDRTQLGLGILLVAAGAYYFLAQQMPALRFWAQIEFAWPFYVIGAGVLILLIGLMTGAPGMAAPACVVAGVGAILYYQDRSGDWASWSFIWSLIPGFAGLGVILAGLLGEDTRRNLRHGLNLLVASAALFVAFAAMFQRLDFLGPYGPGALLVLLGAYVIGRGLLPSRPSGG